MEAFGYISEHLLYILSGLSATLRLFFSVVLIAFPFSILVAILKVSGPCWLKKLLSLYTWVFRGTPLVLQLYVVYYGFPNLGLTWNPWFVATLVFSLSAAAYEAEIIRGGIISIEKGQYEACLALGMSYIQTMRRVIIPQTVRRVLPPTCSEAIILLKDTSLLMVVAIFDLMRRARDLVITDLRVAPFAVALICYLVMASILINVFGKLEKRYSISL